MPTPPRWVGRRRTKQRRCSLTARCFLCTPLGRVIALDPVTGTKRWAFDAQVPREKGWGDYASRGVSAWRRGADRRIFVATIDARLFALDATTGRPISSFGEGGAVDLRQGLRITPTGFADYAVTSPPAVIGDAVVVGSAVADGTGKAHPSGEVRAFNAVIRKLLWSWDPVPQDAGTIGAGYLAGWRCPRRWWRQRLVGDRRRRFPESRLCSDEQPESRLLWRRAGRRQPVLRFGGGATR